MADGESFAITRAILAHLYPDGQLLSYKGGATRTASARRLRSDLDSTPLTMTGGS
jgi:hypothetical protein